MMSRYSQGMLTAAAVTILSISSVVQSATPASSHALECSSTCGKPSSLDFCSHVSFPVCGFETSFQDLDVLALSRYNQWTNTSNTLLTKLPQYANKKKDELDQIVQTLDLHNISSSCGSFLKRLECAIQFPACEIGRDYTRVCEKSCKDHVKKECPGLEGICSSFGPHEVESKGKCFKLEYKGPAVGMWVAGFTISLVFSILNSIGINLQKLSMTRNEAAEVKKGTCGQPLWVLGFSLVALGSLLDFVAFGMAPQTLLAPLAALSLVWNMFIAPIFHKEKVTKENIMATIIIFFGVTLTVIFAGHSTPTYELADLIRLYKQPVMYAYMLMIAGFLGGMFYFSRYIERTHRYEGGLYHIACYGGIAGTFGGQSVLLAKSTVELLKSAIWGESGAYMFTQFASYVIVFGLFACLFFQVHFLNGGLARFDALVVIPVYQSFWILTSVLGGIMYFEEYVSMTPSSMFVFTIGGVITIAGIVFLLQTRQSGEGHDTGRYVELDIESNGSSSGQAVTPSSAWNAEDSDEEEIQLKTHNKMMLDEEDNVHRPVIKSVNLSQPSSYEKSKKVGDVKTTSPHSRSKDDDDFI